jgi:hypothetical protein
VNVRATARALGWLALCAALCAVALPCAAANASGKISGVVIDSSGTPQMGATVLIVPEKATDPSREDLLTNDRGRFVSPTMSVGLYSIKVTLAGFLPSIEEHVQVNDQHTTMLQIVLGSMLTSFDKMRRTTDQELPADEWGWVLRSSAPTRVVLRWQDGDIDADSDGSVARTDAPAKVNHARLEFTNGSDHPGSVSNLADSPGTAFAYDFGIGHRAKLLLAGQFSYEGTSPAGGMDVELLPSGDAGTGPVSSFLIRESRLGPDGPTFRGMRLAHDDQIALGDRFLLRYGGELVSAGLGGNTISLPRAELGVKLSPTWQTAFIVAARPWQDSQSSGELQSAVNNLDALPTLMLREGRPVLENDLHEEIALEHVLSKSSSISAAVFHDRSTHTAVFGIGGPSGPDYLQDFFSNVFAYDGGSSSSMGMRVAYERKVTDNLETTFVYAYGGALSPQLDASDASLRDELATRYQQSVAARVATRIPHSGTKLITSYKWIGGPAVTRVDAYGESLYHLDPYLCVEIRQPLPSFIPGHPEALADFGNLLAQGYVPLSTTDGRLVLVPSYRYFRGGLTFQF